MTFINSENLSGLECIKTFDLANSYYYGIGVEKNIEVAHDLYLKASKFGMSEAQNMLGVICFDKNSGFYNLNKSIEYFEEAMSNKNLTSIFNLAMIYIEIEEKKDYEKAKKYLTYLVDCGYSLASYTLISIFFKIEKTLTHNKADDNIHQSKDTILKTLTVESSIDKQIKPRATIDVNNEKMTLADNYYTGINGDCDYAKAFEIYRELADLGSINAQIKVASMYNDGIGTEKDYSKSLEWYIKTIKSCQPDSKNNNSSN